MSEVRLQPKIIVEGHHEVDEAAVTKHLHGHCLEIGFLAITAEHGDDVLVVVLLVVIRSLGFVRAATGIYGERVRSDGNLSGRPRRTGANNHPVHLFCIVRGTHRAMNQEEGRAEHVEPCISITCTSTIHSEHTKCTFDSNPPTTNLIKEKI